MDDTRKPYEGPEPFIFISYARKNAEKVFPLLDALCGAGYRIWYDAGIHAGEDWKKTLRKKVEGCAVFLPVLSEAFLASEYCFEETNWAEWRRKAIVPVYLEMLDAERISQFLRSRQDLRLFQYDAPAAFVERLREEPLFRDCKEEPPAPCREPEWLKIGQIQWKLDADGVLTIAKNEDLDWSTGSIPGYQSDPVRGASTAPWMPDRKKIRSVVIKNDIDAIGARAFKECASLTGATLGRVDTS